MASVVPSDLRISWGHICHTPCGRVGVRGECATCAKRSQSLPQLGPSFPAQVEREKRRAGLVQHRFHAALSSETNLRILSASQGIPSDRLVPGLIPLLVFGCRLPWSGSRLKFSSSCTWHSIFPRSHSRLMNAISNSTQLLITISLGCSQSYQLAWGSSRRLGCDESGSQWVLETLHLTRGIGAIFR